MGNRLYIGNLAFTTTTDSIRALFETMGQVDDVHVATDRDTGRSRGFAFVTMSSEADARRAIQELHGKDLDGRPLRVDEAAERAPRGGGRGRGR